MGKPKPTNNYNTFAKERARIQRLKQVRVQEQEAARANVRKYRARKHELKQRASRKMGEKVASEMEQRRHSLQQLQVDAGNCLGQAHADAFNFRLRASQKANQDLSSWKKIDGLAQQRAHEARITRERQIHVKKRRTQQRNEVERAAVSHYYAQTDRQKAHHWRTLNTHYQQRQRKFADEAAKRGPEIVGQDVRVATSGANLQDFSHSRLHVRTVVHSKGRGIKDNVSTRTSSMSLNHSSNKTALAAGDSGVRDAMAAARKVREANRIKNEIAAGSRLKAAEKALKRGMEALRRIKAHDSLSDTINLLDNLDKADRLERAQQRIDMQVKETDEGYYEFEESARHEYPTYITSALNPRGSKSDNIMKRSEVLYDDSHRVERNGVSSKGGIGFNLDDRVHDTMSDGESEDERLFEHAFMRDQVRQAHYDEILLNANSDEVFQQSQKLRATASKDDDNENGNMYTKGEHEPLRPPMLQQWIGAQQGDQLLLQRQNLPSTQKNEFDSEKVDDRRRAPLPQAKNKDVCDDDMDLGLDLDQQLAQNAAWFTDVANKARQVAQAVDQ